MKQRIITDREWNLFINDNFVDDEIIEIIAIRIINKCVITDRELAIYDIYNERIEKVIHKYLNKTKKK